MNTGINVDAKRVMIAESVLLMNIVFLVTPRLKNTFTCFFDKRKKYDLTATNAPQKIIPININSGE